jgi:hypothetical protein
MGLGISHRKERPSTTIGFVLEAQGRESYPRFHRKRYSLVASKVVNDMFSEVLFLMIYIMTSELRSGLQ